MRLFILLYPRPFLLVLVMGGLLARPGRAQQLPAAPAAEVPVLAYAEQMPAFPGGEVALHAYLVRQIKYPAQALRRRLSGQVVVQFVVDEQGRVLNPVVVKTTDAEFNAEALRLAWLMPWWTPGLDQGRPVRVRCTLPILFTFKQ